jgi:hypothetical protein
MSSMIIQEFSAHAVAEVRYWCSMMHYLLNSPEHVAAMLDLFVWNALQNGTLIEV